MIADLVKGRIDALLVEMIADLVKGRIDVLLVSETKIDNSFPSSPISDPWPLYCLSTGSFIKWRGDSVIRQGGDSL